MGRQLHILTVVVTSLWFSGCIRPQATECDDGRVCPANLACDEINHECVDPSKFASCDGVADNEPCTFSGGMGTCQQGLCIAFGCGNGVEEDPEVCDDGNVTPGDGCSFDCLSTEVCGNGYTDFVPGERCDDGGFLSSDGCSSACQVEVTTWKVQPPQPQARTRHALAYDVARQRVVLFGGIDSANQLADTWEWDGTAWTDVTPVSSPPVRHDHKLAYDAARERVVLFGGIDAAGPRNDTWEWDGATWTDVTSATSPPGRSKHALAYDAARQRVVLFGGLGLTDTDPWIDTWEWDGTTWTDVTPATSPQSRYSHALAYDAARQRVVLFGGFDVGGRRSDTWEWDGSAWSEIPGSSPPQRAMHALAYDAARQRVVLFGGSDGSEINDTWEWDGTTWTDVTPTNSPDSPEVRSRHALAYDAARQRVVLFSGGEISDDDTWEWDGTLWSNVTPGPPPARFKHALAYDGAHQQVILFGGLPDTSSPANPLGDTWGRSGGVWKDLAPATSPTARSATALAYDAARQRVILFGGRDESGSDLADTWEWDGTTWTDVTPANSPPTLAFHALAYDAARERVVLFGKSAIELPAETWEWDGTTWTDVTPTNSPPDRRNHKLAYDAARERVVMFAGFSSAGPLDDTWEWDGTTWTDVTPTNSPQPRSQHALTYDAARQRVILFGGLGVSGQAGLADTWEWDGTTWTDTTPPNLPQVRFNHALAYDAAQRQVVLFAGGGLSGSLRDTWTYQYESADPQERCRLGVDLDADGLSGCDDPDCWGICRPFCPPGALCDPAAPGCGDAICNSDLESHLSCPADCTRPIVCGDFVCDPTEVCAADCP